MYFGCLVAAVSALSVSCGLDFNVYSDRPKYLVEVLPTPVSDEDHLIKASYLVHGADNRSYSCNIADDERTEKSSQQEFPTQVLTPNEVLKKFHGKCFEFVTGSYWNYSICVGENVTQYHRSEDGNIYGKNYFILGYYESDQTWSEAQLNSSHSPTRIHHNQHYARGDLCSNMNISRSAELQFICKRSAPLVVVSSYEKSDCSYVFTVISSDLCSIPVFAASSLPSYNRVHCSLVLSKKDYNKYLEGLRRLKSLNLKPLIPDLGEVVSKILTDLPPHENGGIPIARLSLLNSGSFGGNIIQTKIREMLHQHKASDESKVQLKFIIEQENEDVSIKWKLSYREGVDFNQVLEEGISYSSAVRDHNHHSTQREFNKIISRNDLTGHQGTLSRGVVSVVELNFNDG